MNRPIISLIASSVRPHLWESCFESLTNNVVKFEVVFAGNVTKDVYEPFEKKYPFFRYIETGNIKPAQCYQVAFIKARGFYICWIADDCEFSKNALDKICDRTRFNKKLYSQDSQLFSHNSILSLRTNENNLNNDLDDHRFFERNKNTPLMAPLGVISKHDLDVLNGFDRRFLCGQYENDVVMRALAHGGKVIKFEEVCVTIDHIKKHGNTTKFWSGYDYDRKVLEDTWVLGGYAPAEAILRVFKPSENVPMKSYRPITNREVSKIPLLTFEPYDNKDILTVSQGYKGMWE